MRVGERERVVDGRRSSPASDRWRLWPGGHRVLSQRDGRDQEVLIGAAVERALGVRVRGRRELPDRRRRAAVGRKPIIAGGAVLVKDRRGSTTPWVDSGLLKQSRLSGPCTMRADARRRARARAGKLTSAIGRSVIRVMDPSPQASGGQVDPELEQPGRMQFATAATAIGVRWQPVRTRTRSVASVWWSRRLASAAVG